MRGEVIYINVVVLLSFVLKSQFFFCIYLFLFIGSTDSLFFVFSFVYILILTTGMFNL